MECTTYDHYVAIDWSIKTMAIARMTRKSNAVHVFENVSDIKDVQVYLANLQGCKIVVLEETTAAQWLYTELQAYADKVFICDPHRNRLLSEGSKTDKIDAVKLVKLLKTGLMKEVYHSNELFLHLRKLVSSYEDHVKAGVRLKNQRSALIRSCGRNTKKVESLGNCLDDFVLRSIDKQIEAYEQQKKDYEKIFEKLARTHTAIGHQKSIPGIGSINAVKIISRVVSPKRFPDKGHYLSYAGLVKLERMSGGRSYGKKISRYSRQLKGIYKTGVISALSGNNHISNYYEYLIREKGYEAHNARHKACRRLAIISLGVFKSGKKYQERERAKKKEDNN